MSLNCLDLFAGGGGLSEGFINAGFKIISHVEMNPDACLTLKTRLCYHYLKNDERIETYKDYLSGALTRNELYNSVPQDILNSVICCEMNSLTRQTIFSLIDTKLNTEKVDIIIGGPPCQAYSLIGRNQTNKIDDKRKYLYKEYIQYLIKYKPSLYIFENVKGILSAKDEKGNLIIDNLRNEMMSINYTFHFKILNSIDFNVPQKRERVFIIGWKNSMQLTYPEFQSIKPDYHINALFSDLPKLGNGEVCTTIKYSNDSCVSKDIKKDDWDILTQHNARSNNENDRYIYKYILENFKLGIKITYNQLPSNLQNHENTKSFLDRFKVVDGNGYSHTIMAHLSKDGHYYIHPDISQNRSLTVREAARIQSFPDNYYFESSRTSAFIQIGNAVPPLMAFEIANKIKEML